MGAGKGKGEGASEGEGEWCSVNDQVACGWRRGPYPTIMHAASSVDTALVDGSDAETSSSIACGPSDTHDGAVLYDTCLSFYDEQPSNRRPL